jgi:RNA polymerase sigma-70 factor (ECF subfamily)
MDRAWQAGHDLMTRTDEGTRRTLDKRRRGELQPARTALGTAIYALAYRVIGREEEARDVVQETFLRAFRGIKNFRGQAKFSSWVYRIALNLCPRLDPAGTPRPHPGGPRRDRPRGAGRRAGAGRVDRNAGRPQRHECGRGGAMALLPDEQRTAIVLKEYHGMTFQEIADLQGCPLSTVKTRLYQGLSVLRRHLQQQGKYDPARTTVP